MQKTRIEAAHSISTLAWGGLVAGYFLLSGCTAGGEAIGHWSQRLDSEAELAKMVQNDPFPTAAEIGVASKAASASR